MLSHGHTVTFCNNHSDNFDKFMECMNNYCSDEKHAQ
jgi:hypothetical protein